MAYKSVEKKQPGLEYPAANEDEIAAEMVNELTAQLDRLYKDKKMLRQIHTKMHGCVKAFFTIEPDLPEKLKAGVFRQHKTYHAWVRMSNASTNPKPDKKKDVRGFAIKLMGVPGEKILNDEHLKNTQDFLLMNTETFFSKNVGEFRGLLAAATSANKLRLVGFALNPKHWALLKRFSQSNMACRNPLEMKYYSTQPYQFGNPHVAVKYFLRPSTENKLVVENETDYDYLRINLAQTLYNNEAKFDFLVQFQTDADAMPIEDPTVPWTSEFIKVASLTIPTQTFDSKKQMAFGDSLSFNSWHSLPDHRPLGGFNRVRKRIYEALSKYRHEKNDLPVFEPMDSTDFLMDTNTNKSGQPGTPIPKTGLIKAAANVLVNCSKEAAFTFISSGDELTNWLKKYGPISPEKNVEIIKGPYSIVGAKRKVIFENGDSLQEELISYNPGTNYAYSVTRFSNFLKYFSEIAYGQLWFDRVDEKTRITWVYSYTYKNIFGRMALWLFCKLLFKKYMKHSLINAKEKIENSDL